MHSSPNRDRQLPPRNAWLPLLVSCLTAREWNRKLWGVQVFSWIKHQMVGGKKKKKAFFIPKSISSVLSLWIWKIFITTSFPVPPLGSPIPLSWSPQIQETDKQSGRFLIPGCYCRLFWTHHSYCCLENLRLSERRNSRSTVSSVVSTGTLLFSTGGE